MAPLPKVASQPPTKGDGLAEDGDTQQYGRSSSSLNVELAAGGVRESDRRNSQGSHRSPSAPKLLRKESSKSASSPNPRFAGSANPPPPPPDRRTSYAPAVSSPLNPTIPIESVEARIDNERKTSDESNSSTSPPQDGGGNGETFTGRTPPRPSLRRPIVSKSLEMTEAESLYRQNALMSVWDLGSDYSRYFNPFSDSRRSSFVETSTPLPRRNTVAGPNGLSLPSGSSGTPGLAPNPFSTPRASTTKLNSDAEAEKRFSMFLDDRLGAPILEESGHTFRLYAHEKEDDDDMHLPQPDDDIKYKATLRDRFTRGNIVSTFGMLFMLIGLLCVFVALPVLAFGGIISYGTYQTPLDEMWKGGPPAEAWAIVNNRTYPLLKNIRTGLIDPTTPQSAMSRTAINGDELELVFSDEFNDNNRTFYEGDDPYWFAPDIWYGATVDLDWYDPDAVTTWEGTLELRLDKFPNHNVNFRSGMLNSWNHLCFKGGVYEVSVSLPGPAGVMGLWPGAWTMGNLGRPGYLSTTEGMWPYTYDSCDAGITPNQSSYDGLSRLPGQRLPSCTCPGEDHPTPGRGRGAPEIDILEAGASYAGLGIITQSYQVAPFDIWYYPDYNFTMFPDYRISYTNGYTGGPFQQALSATTNLNRDWYDGKAYQKYAFEYVPGEGEQSYIAWYVGDQMTWMMDGRAIGPNGNIASRQISQEPMSLVLNLGLSNSWTYIDWARLVFPTVMRVDYVRWYQKKGNRSVTCDPPGWETTEYIKQHMNAYTNPNFTVSEAVAAIGCGMLTSLGAAEME